MQWNGYNTGQSYGWLYKNAYDGSKGWLAGFVGTTTPEFRLLIGGAGYKACTWNWEIGKWYDFAFAIEDNGDSDTLSFYRWADGGQFESQTINIGAAFNGATISGDTLIGSESTAASGNGLKAFSGTLDNLAVWDRTLSASEIHEVFGASHSVWSVGVEDNSPYDMQHESSVSDANYTPGQPWNEMPRAVSTSLPSAFVNFDLTAEQAALSQVFHLDLDGFGSGATAEVKLNGVSLGSVSQAEGTQYSWLIAANKFQVGSNTLEISRTGGSYVAWDWMELGGSWQLGMDDGDHAEFCLESSAPDDFYVTDPNTAQHLERALTPGDPELNLHFFLSEELAEYDFLYTTKTVEMWGPFGSFDVLLNGNLVGAFDGGGQGEYFDLPISGEFAEAGENVLTLQYTGTSGNVVFDFHRLQIVPEPASAAMLGIGLLAILLFRRKRN